MPLRSASSRRALLVFGAAIVMAFLSAKVLFDASIVNALPWGLLAFATGFMAANGRESLRLGTIFGFVVSYAFLWFNNSGTKTLEKVLTLIPLVVLPALFGALCGLIAAWLGWKVKQLVSKGDS